MFHGFCIGASGCSVSCFLVYHNRLFDDLASVAALVGVKSN